MVVIDNLSGLSDSRQGEQHSYRLASYMKDCCNYGIKYVVTSTYLNQVAARIRQTIGTRIALNMKDRYDYSDALECKVNYLPANKPGRGLFCMDERPLELQCVLFRAAQDSNVRTEQLKQELKSIAKRFSDCTGARRLPTISESVTFADFARQFPGDRIPLGYDVVGKKAVALPLKQFSGLSCYLGNPVGKKPILENFLQAAEREHMELWVVRRQTGSLFALGEGGTIPELKPENAVIFDAGSGGADMLRLRLLDEMMRRSELIQKFAAEYPDQTDPTQIRLFLQRNTRPVLVLLESLADLASGLASDTDMFLSKMLASSWKMGIYSVSMFEPDDYKNVQGGMLYRCFNPDGNILMLGGRYDRQQICDIPAEEMTQKELPFNTGFMQYRTRRHPVLIPCGEIKGVDEDPDMASIF